MNQIYKTVLTTVSYASIMGSTYATTLYFFPIKDSTILPYLYIKPNG